MNKDLNIKSPQQSQQKQQPNKHIVQTNTNSHRNIDSIWKDTKHIITRDVKWIKKKIIV